MKLTRKYALSLDNLREALNDRGFDFETPYDMLSAIENAISTGKRVYGTRAIEEMAGAADGSPQPSANLQSLATKPDVVVSRPSQNFGSDSKTALAWSLANIRRTVENADASMPIRISRDGLEKSLSESAIAKSHDREAHIAAVSALPELLQRAVLAESRADRSNDKNLKAIHRFFAPMEFGGKLIRVKLTVKDTATDGARHYSHELAEIEVPAVIWEAAYSTGELTSPPRLARSRYRTSCRAQHAIPAERSTSRSLIPQALSRPARSLQQLRRVRRSRRSSPSRKSSAISRVD